MVNIDLIIVSYLDDTKTSNAKHTAPESTVFGTATRIGSGKFASFRAFCVDKPSGIPSRHIANGQKFKVLTVNACNNHGCFVEAAAASIGSALSRSASSAVPSCHTRSLLSLPWLETSICQWNVTPNGFALEWYARNDSFCAPRPNAQNSVPMGLPRSYGSLEGKIPRDNPTVGIGSQKPDIALREMQSVYLGRVAPENESWLCRWKQRR